jgi:hypothetical protein
MKQHLHFLLLSALAVGGTALLGAVRDHYGRAADNPIQAQQLVKEMMAANPDLLAAGMHCIPPGGDRQAIIASTLDVIGKPSDPEDILRGGTTIELSKKGPKLGIMLPLHDRAGREIGSLALQFKYPAGADQVKCFATATVIRDRVAQQIPALADLFTPAHQSVLHP